MSETRPKVYSLLALSQAIRNLLAERIGQQSFWLRAEIAQIKQAASGHWYMDLVQEKNHQRLASMSAVIWKLDYEAMIDKHGPDIKPLLIAGQELVLRVMVDYHPLYGLKLLIKDLDLSFVLGELERRKRETLDRLEKEGLLKKQKEIASSLVYQNIAVLCSEEAAAYQDFVQHLMQNEFGYRLQCDLYPVPVQGVAAADKIRAKLESLPIERYELVVIIRGGGSRLDLDAFNDEALARTAALFPLAIHTGIGHESDLSVLDIVAHKAHKTPTAVADYLLDKMQAFEGQLQQIATFLENKSKDILSLESERMHGFLEILRLLPLSQIRSSRGDIHQVASSMVRLSADGIRAYERHLEAIGHRLKEKPQIQLRREAEQLSRLQDRLNELGKIQLERMQKDLGHLVNRLELLKPERTLERGYSITRKDEKSVNSVLELKEDEVIETQVKDGRFSSRIIKIERNE